MVLVLKLYLALFIIYGYAAHLSVQVLHIAIYLKICEKKCQQCEK